MFRSISTGFLALDKRVSLKFNISKYTNKPINRKPSLMRVLTALEAAPETCVVVNVILFISCPD